MAILTKGPRGTQDVLPSQSYKWQYLEKKVMEIAGLYGFREIRVPTFEHTELFNRSVGDTTSGMKNLRPAGCASFISLAWRCLAPLLPPATRK